MICDYPEETWHSTDLYADMLIEYLQLEHSYSFDLVKVYPKFQPRLQLLPWLEKKKAAYTANYFQTRHKSIKLNRVGKNKVRLF